MDSAPPSTSQEQGLVAKPKGCPPPVLCLSILGHHFAGLLDSGSSHSVMGKTGIAILRDLHIKTKPYKIKVSFAQGGATDVQEEAELEVTWHNGETKRDVSFLLVPDSPYAVILGRDFIIESDIIMYLRVGLWSFGSDPKKYFKFDNVCRHEKEKRIDGSKDLGWKISPSKKSRRRENIEVGSQSIQEGVDDGVVPVVAKKSKIG